MSLIKNLIKEPIETPTNKRKKRKNAQSDEEASDDAAAESNEKMPRPIVRTATDLQRLRLEKLMKNPEKPVIIPEQRQQKDYLSSVPSFVRNVMGSSAGAGSGEFHVYRHLRRKEYARQKNIQMKSRQEELDEEYQNKLESNRLAAAEKTAKKRAKRLKKKERAKQARRLKQQGSKNATDAQQQQQSSSSTESSDVEQEDEAENENVAAPAASDETVAVKSTITETAAEAIPKTASQINTTKEQVTVTEHDESEQIVKENQQEITAATNDEIAMELPTATKIVEDENVT